MIVVLRDVSVLLFHLEAQKSSDGGFNSWYLATPSIIIFFSFFVDENIERFWICFFFFFFTTF